MLTVNQYYCQSACYNSFVFLSPIMSAKIKYYVEVILILLG